MVDSTGNRVLDPAKSHLIESEKDFDRNPGMQRRLKVQRGFYNSKARGARSLNEIFDGQHLRYKAVNLLDRLIGAKKKEPICSRCKRVCWRGIYMQLFYHCHHKDSDPKNNALANLEILCPNCHVSEHRSENAEATLPKIASKNKNKNKNDPKIQ